MPSDTSSRSPDFPGLNALLAPRLDDHARWGAVADDWSIYLGERRAFRIRGFTWFRESVERNVRALVPAVYRMESELRRRQSWLTPPWPWKEKYSAAQLTAALKGEPLRFDKAVKTLLLGQLVAAEKGISSSEYYLHMRIEPATFRVSGFDKDYLDKAFKTGLNLPKVLGDSLGQPQRVFRRMAAGESVSFRLAYWTRQVLLRAAPQWPPGNVEIGLDKSSRVVCLAEIVGGTSDPEAAQQSIEPGYVLDLGTNQTQIRPPRPWPIPGPRPRPRPDEEEQT